MGLDLDRHPRRRGRSAGRRSAGSSERARAAPAWAPPVAERSRSPPSSRSLVLVPTALDLDARRHAADRSQRHRRRGAGWTRRCPAVAAGRGAGQLVEHVDAAVVRPEGRGPAAGHRHHRRPDDAGPGPRPGARTSSRVPRHAARVRDPRRGRRPGRAHEPVRHDASSQAAAARACGRSTACWRARSDAAHRGRARRSPPLDCPALSYFFPAHNEAANLTGLVEEALATLPGLAEQFEIVIVDDGSKDATPALADELAAAHPAVRAVHHPTNLGYGAALRSGFAAARFDHLAYTDGDRQFKVADLGRLIERLEAGTPRRGRRATASIARIRWFARSTRACTASPTGSSSA